MSYISVLDAPDGLWALIDPHWAYSPAWLRIFSAAWSLPMNPPRPSGFGEEQVNVGQLLKPLPPHSHIKLPTLQLIPVIHLCPLVRVEAAAQHTQSVFLGKHKLLLKPIGLCAFYLRTPPKTLKPIFSVIISSILSNCPSILWWISNLTAGFKTSPFATTLQRVQKTRKITSLLISDAGCMSHPRWPFWSSKVNEENCICTMWLSGGCCVYLL